MTKFVALFDAHYGYERKNGHKTPLHDSKAINAALKFVKDFKPDITILGGDILDCGAVSHHNHGKPGAVEGLRLVGDADELRKVVIEPVQEYTKDKLIYITGNHEGWLTDLSDQIPALEGIIDVRSILHLSKRWTVVPQGEMYKLGKLVFIHGDQIKGGEHAAKNAVSAYERNVRMGHFHCFQAYSKTSAVDANGHTALIVPCLCKKGPGYGGGAPNKWMQGFLWGYVGQGVFNDYVTVIVDGKCIVNGKEYKG